ncbi:MAG: PilZ domain-containing protein [Bdellovibrio sp.]|nr:MAG: PilZ domain-containing protein [Bdellovibrio sp.]
MSAQRYETNEPASIEVYGRRSIMAATLRNLSATGACLSWDKEGFQLETGDLVCLTVELGGLNRRHRVNAEVIWRAGKEMGVTFIPREDLVQRFTNRTRR